MLLKTDNQLSSEEISLININSTEDNLSFSKTKAILYFLPDIK
jgi:hypothetical protein